MIILRLLAVTIWALAYAFHLALDWGHNFHVVHELLAGISPILVTEVVFVAALFSATTLTAIDLLTARSRLSFSCSTAHLLNVVMVWSLLDPAIVVQLVDLHPLLVSPITAISTLCAATLATVVEYTHAVRHVLRRSRGA